MQGAGMTSHDLVRHIPSPPLMRFAVRWWSAYLLLAVIASWPLAWSPGSAIPRGCESEATVPLLNVWTVWWNADRAAVSFRGYWDAPIFYPTRGTFAFSEAQPSSLVVAPVIGLTGNRVLAYNVYLFLILTFNGWSGHRLMRRVGHRTWLACCGGILCEMLPFVWWQLGVIQLTTLFGCIWTIHALLDLFEPHARPKDGATIEDLTSTFRGIWRFLRRSGSHSEYGSTHDIDPSDSPGTVRDHTVFRRIPISVRLGFAFSLTYWMCNYWGLFLAILLVPSSVCLWNGRLLRAVFWRDVLIAGLLVLGLVGPIASIQRSLSSKHAWSRTPELIRDLSAHPNYYLDPPFTVISAAGESKMHDDGVVAKVAYAEWSTFFRGRQDAGQQRSLWTLGFGWIKLSLVSTGLAAALVTRGRRRWGLFVATFGLTAFGLSLGPTVCVSQFVPWLGGVSIYEVLQRIVPGFGLIRSPFRYAVFVQLAAVWASVEALDLFDPRRWRKSSDRRTIGSESQDLGDQQVLREERGIHGEPADVCPPLAGKSDRRVGRWLVFVPLVLLSLIVIFEVWPAPQQLHRCATPNELPVWILWLRENTYSDDPIVCLPFPTGYTVTDYEDTATWMYWGTFHGRHLLNGYSGFFPESFVTLKSELSVFHRNPGYENAAPELRMYPADSAGLKRLNASGAKYVVLKRSFASRDDVWQHPLTKFRWAWVSGDEREQIDIYEINPVFDE
jgi:hypothetical protein